MHESPISSLIVAGGATFGALGTVVARMTGERDTPAGRAAARWLGLREHLADDTLFADQPPAAVAVWDRHLAYGVAFGVAHGAVRALPLGAESDDVAWSPVGGRWRVVRVRYPPVPAARVRLAAGTRARGGAGERGAHGRSAGPPVTCPPW